MGEEQECIYLECKYEPKKKTCRDYEMIKISSLILMIYHPCWVAAGEQDLGLSTKARSLGHKKAVLQLKLYSLSCESCYSLSESWDKTEYWCPSELQNTLVVLWAFAKVAEKHLCVSWTEKISGKNVFLQRELLNGTEGFWCALRRDGWDQAQGMLSELACVCLLIKGLGL